MDRLCPGETQTAETNSESPPVTSYDMAGGPLIPDVVSTPFQRRMALGRRRNNAWCLLYTTTRKSFNLVIVGRVVDVCARPMGLIVAGRVCSANGVDCHSVQAADHRQIGHLD